MHKERLAIYDAIVEQCPRFKRKGKTMPYTSANGHMFSLLNKAGELGFRYSKEVQTQYLEKYNTNLFMSNNAVIKGYILITETMLQNTEELVELINQSYDFVKSLDPK